MIQRIEKIPVTPESHPFAHAAPRCHFDQLGYEEDEFFLFGTSNVYEEDAEGNVSVLFPDAPYVNRMLVRRPSRKEAFSGNVVVEILNPSALYDIDRMWVEAWRYFTAHGDIYIGITSKGDVLDTLYRIDPKRYERISWANPLPDRPLPEGGIFPVYKEYENGLFWDMLTDLAIALRTESPVNPIAGYGKPYVYLTGWSQCGGLMVRYRETFADKASERLGAPIYDGYLQAGSGSTPAPINTCQKASDFWETRKDFRGYIASPQPYIVMNTETETPYTRWKGDMDEPWARFRTYDISGSSHDSKYNLLDYYETDDDPAKVGRDQPYFGLEKYPQDYPYEFVYSAAYRNLFVWVREGVPAPTSRQLERLPDGQSKKDAFGNTRGGVRTPFIDLPTCLYSKYSTLKSDPTKQSDFWGHVEPFSPAMLKELYGNLAVYEAKAAERTDELIAQGYLLQCQREDIIRTAVNFARERGLE